MINYIGYTMFDKDMDFSDGLINFIERRLSVLYDKDFVSNMNTRDKYITYSVSSLVGFDKLKTINEIAVFNSCELNNNGNIKNYVKLILSIEDKLYFHELDTETITNIGNVKIQDVKSEFYKKVDFVEWFKELDFIKKMSSHVLVGCIYNCNINGKEFFELCKISYEKILNPKQLSIYSDVNIAAIKEEHIKECVLDKSNVRKMLEVDINNTKFYLYYTL